MFKLRNVLLLGSAVLAVACAKEIPMGGGGQDKYLIGETGDVVLDLTMPDSEGKTVLGEKSGDSYPVYWQTGDVVAMNGVVSNAVPESDNGKDKTSLYVKNVTLTAPFNVLYPGEAGVTDKVTFPSNQSYKEGSFDVNSLPMYATAQNLTSGFTMNYLGSVLRIPVRFTSDTYVKNIILTSVGGEGISGTFTVGNTSDALNGELSSYAPLTTVTLEVNSEFAANTTAVFHLAIPKGTYSKGMEMKLYDVDGNYMKAGLFEEDGSVLAGKVYEFTTRNYTQDGTAFFISTVEDLQNFASTKGGSKFALLEAIVVNDIDMTGNEYPGGEWFNFHGTLEGNNKTITGLTKPMFNQLLGTVRNLTLNSNISYGVDDYTDDTSNPGNNNGYGIGILAHYVKGSDSGDEDASEYFNQVIENVIVSGSLDVTCNPTVEYHIGGLAGASNGIPFTNCVNNADITYENSTSSSNVFIGGIVGVAQSNSDADLKGCVNNGSVSVNDCTIKSALYYGGITGYSKQAIEITGCTNNAPLLLEGGTCSNLFFGGVIGQAQNANLAIDTPRNTALGTVTLDGHQANDAFYIGGITGTHTASISNAENRGSLSIDGTVQKLSEGTTATGNISVGGIAGRGQGVINGAANYGNVSIESTTIANVPNGIYVGGIVGNANNAATDIKGTIINNGDVNCNADCTNGKTSYVGGVCGSMSNNAREPTGYINRGEVSAGGSTSGELRIGGVFGYCSKTTDSCTNESTGIVTMGANVTKYTYTAGVCGYADGDIQKGTNRGQVSFTGKSGVKGQGGGDPYVGGIVGLTSKSTDGTNNGKIYVSSTIHEAKNLYVGGLAGYFRNTALNGTNNGPIEINGLKCSNASVGGLVGTINGATSITGSNTGSVSVADLSCGGVNIGGCVGDFYNSASTGAVSNSGPVSVGNGSSFSSHTYVGGVAGWLENDKTESTEYTYNNFTNSGNVTVDVSGMKDPCIGGIAGSFNDDIGNDGDYSLVKYTITATNSGHVWNKSNQGQGLYIGGIAGWTKADITFNNCINTGNVTNDGTLSGSVIRIGGLVGGSGYRNTLSGCRNGEQGTQKGAVTNNGDVESSTISIGGVAGQICGEGAAAEVENCVNYAPIYNSGTSNDNPGLREGGLIGWANIVCTINTEGNINYGSVTDASESQKPALGGAVGYANNASSEISNCVNNGTVTMDGGEKTYPAIGGVCGWVTAAVTMNDNTNNGDIYLKNFSIAESMSVGGVLGTYNNTTTQTFSNLTNTGGIIAKNLDHVKCKSTGAGAKFCYIGGICSGAYQGATKTSKTYDGCMNTGRIDFGKSGNNEVKVYARIGGIAGYANQDAGSNGLICRANINYYYSTADVDRCQIGGIFGYNNHDISNCTYEGTMYTTSTKNAVILGGIVGSINQAHTISNCKVSGQIKGSGSGEYMAGLFCSHTTSETVDKKTKTLPIAVKIVNCKVKSSTKYNDTSLMSDGDLTGNRLVGAGHTTCSGSDLDCKIVSSF